MWARILLEAHVETLAADAVLVAELAVPPGADVLHRLGDGDRRRTCRAPREAEHRNASDQQRNARIDGTFPPSLRLGQQTTLSIFVHSLIQKETIVFVFH